MMKGGHGQTNQLHDINWGALNHIHVCTSLTSLIIKTRYLSVTQFFVLSLRTYLKFHIPTESFNTHFSLVLVCAESVDHVH